MWDTLPPQGRPALILIKNGAGTNENPNKMNADKIVKSLIPQVVIEGAPSEKQAHVAAKIVKFFRESAPDLYERLEASESLTDELTAECAAAIDEAVRKAREHHLEIVKLHGGK